MFFNKKLVTILCAVSAMAADLPQGSKVVEGDVAISTDGNTMNMHQSTRVASVEWQSFDIGAENQVNIHQPTSNSVSVHSVVGNDMSTIAGGLWSNGQVFLRNPAGIHWVDGAAIDVPTLGLLADKSDAPIRVDHHVQNDDMTLFLEGLNIEINAPVQVRHLGIIQSHVDLAFSGIGVDALSTGTEYDRSIRPYIEIKHPITAHEMFFMGVRSVLNISAPVSLKSKHIEGIGYDYDEKGSLIIIADEFSLNGTIDFDNDGDLSVVATAANVDLANINSNSYSGQIKVAISARDLDVHGENTDLDLSTLKLPVSVEDLLPED